MNNTIFFFVNPKAKKVHDEIVQRIALTWKEQGKTVEVIWDWDNLDINKINLAQKIVIGGGDGTLHRFINKFQETLTEAHQILILPLGTQNVFVTYLGFDPDPLKIAHHIDSSQLLEFSPGEIIHASGKKELFFLMVDAGITANIVHDVSHTLKKMVSKFAYVISFFKNLIFLKEPAIQVMSSQGTQNVNHVIISRIHLYGGDYSLHDPFSSLLVTILPTGRWNILSRLCNLFLRRKRNLFSSQTQQFLVDAVELSTSKEIIFQSDGDVCGMLPISIQISKKKLFFIQASSCL